VLESPSINIPVVYGPINVQLNISPSILLVVDVAFMNVSQFIKSQSDTDTSVSNELICVLSINKAIPAVTSCIWSCCTVVFLDIVNNVILGDDGFIIVILLPEPFNVVFSGKIKAFSTYTPGSTCISKLFVPDALKNCKFTVAVAVAGLDNVIVDELTYTAVVFDGMPDPITVAPVNATLNENVADVIVVDDRVVDAVIVGLIAFIAFSIVE
jgi:hypothetical protein